MVFLSLSTLIKYLRKTDLNPLDACTYFLATGFISVIPRLLEDVFFGREALKPLDDFGSLLFLVIPGMLLTGALASYFLYILIRIYYFSNGGHDGKCFFERLSMFMFFVEIRVIAFQWLASLVLKLAKLHLIPGLVSMAFAILPIIVVIYYAFQINLAFKKISR